MRIQFSAFCFLLILLFTPSGCATPQGKLSQENIDDIAACTGGIAFSKGLTAHLNATLPRQLSGATSSAGIDAKIDSAVQGYIFQNMPTNQALETYKAYLNCMKERRESRANQALRMHSQTIHFDLKRSIDFSKLRMSKDGKRHDIVIFEDKFTFVDPFDQNVFVRRVWIPKFGGAQIQDLITGKDITPPFEAGGSDRVAQVSLKVDSRKHESRIRYTYTDVYGENDEGMGVTSTPGFAIRNINASYRFPSKVSITNQRIRPSELENKILKSSDGIVGENLNWSGEIEHLWTWNVWTEKK